MRSGHLIFNTAGIVTWADPNAQMMLCADKRTCVSSSLAELLQFDEKNHRRMKRLLAGEVEQQPILHATVRGLPITAHISLAREAKRASPAERHYRCVLFTAQAESASGANALNDMKFRSAVQSVISSLAHEMRNPLMAILNVTESVAAGLPQDGELHEALSRVPGMVTRIERLMKQAQEYCKISRPERGFAPIEDIIESAFEMIAPRHPGKHPQSQIQHFMSMVYVDAEQAERIVANVLDNACGAANRTVTLSAFQKPEKWPGVVVIEIEDDGPGIKESVQRRLFKPFFTTKSDGTGIGLAMARDLARLNGGDLHLGHTGAGGTMFRILLPTSHQAVLLKDHAHASDTPGRR